MPTLQEEEAPIHKRIVDELIELTPESWTAIELEVTYAVEDSMERYAHVISSPDGHREPITPSEDLFGLTYDLGRAFLRHGKHWKRAVYRVRTAENDAWKYTVDFEY